MPPVSPFTYIANDAHGHALSITIPWDGSGNLLAATVTRDHRCLYRHLYFGLGHGGIPDTTLASFRNITGTVATSYTLTVADLNMRGLFTYADLFKGQVTAGP